MNTSKVINKIKYQAYNTKEWLKKLYVYPQTKIGVGKHFDYDAYWRERRGAYMGRLGHWQALRAELSAEIIKKKNVLSINDIGSGAGEVLKEILKNFPGVSGTAYDSSPYALEIAKSFGLETVFFDINNRDDFGKIKKSDFTLMFEILEHVAGPEELLKLALERSNMGVLFSFPNTGFVIHRFRLFFFGKFPLQWTKHPGEHLRFWTKKDLIWWLSAQGYNNFKIHYYVGVPLLKNIWPNLFCAGFFVEIYR